MDEELNLNKSIVKQTPSRIKGSLLRSSLGISLIEAFKTDRLIYKQRQKWS